MKAETSLQIQQSKKFQPQTHNDVDKQNYPTKNLTKTIIKRSNIRVLGKGRELNKLN